MQSAQSLSAVPDDELLRQLAALVHESRKTEADLVAHVGEVDARRLYAREAVPSMFQYCTERLHLSGAEAYLCIAAARAAREHPVILTMLSDGRLHLSAIAMLSPHLTPANRDAVLERATHRTKREIEELLAEISPRPDALALIRKLPERRTGVNASAVPSTDAATQAASALSFPAGRAGAADALTTSAAPGVPRELPAVPTAAQASAGRSRPATHERDVTGTPIQLRPDGVGSGSPSRTILTAWRVEPLSPSRYKVQFTASADLREKLERLQNLMRSSVADGDLASVIDAAVTEKLERLERRRFGRTKAPRAAEKNVAGSRVVAAPREQDVSVPTSPKAEAASRSRHVPAAVRRAVHDRDGTRCAFVDAQGRRCTARARLELHHRHTFALGGEHSSTNVALLCRMHNRYMAEIDYGVEAMSRFARRGPRSDRSSS